MAGCKPVMGHELLWAGSAVMSAKPPKAAVGADIQFGSDVPEADLATPDVALPPRKR
jgi:hypothetical protein